MHSQQKMYASKATLLWNINLEFSQKHLIQYPQNVLKKIHNDLLILN